MNTAGKGTPAEHTGLTAGPRTAFRSWPWLADPTLGQLPYVPAEDLSAIRRRAGSGLCLLTPVLPRVAGRGQGGHFTRANAQ